MKVSKALLLIFSLVFVLAACSPNSSASSSTGSNSTTGGAKTMQDTLVELQKNVDANDSAKAKASADKLEESWKKFEDDVKKNQPDIYGKVEDPLGAIQTGAKQSKLDQNTLKDQINKLNEALKQIK